MFVTDALSTDVSSAQVRTRLRHMMHGWWLSILLALCSFVFFGFTAGFPAYQHWLIGTYMALQGSAVAVLTGSAVFNGAKLLAALQSGLETLPAEVREQRKRNVARLQLYMKSCIVLGPTCASGFVACGVIPFFNANSGFYMDAVWLCGFFFLSIVTYLMNPTSDRSHANTRVQPQPVTNVNAAQVSAAIEIEPPTRPAAEPEHTAASQHDQQVASPKAIVTAAWSNN